MLDSFVVLPLAAKLSMTALPGNEVKVLLYVRKKCLGEVFQFKCE